MQSGVIKTPSVSNCSHFNTTIFTAVAGVRCFSAVLSILASLSVTVMILVFRKYHFFIQRLILYLSFASIFNGLSKALQLAFRHPTTKLGRDYCTIVAFMDQQSDWSVFLSTLVITIHLYLKAVHNKTLKLEILCLITIFIMPITFNWVPFIHNTYAEAGPWCWINLYDKNCTRNNFGLGLRIALWFVPSNLIIVIITVLYGIMLISLRRQKYKYKAQYSPQLEMDWKMKKREVRVLILYPLALLLVEIPASVSRIIEMVYDQSIYPLWFIQAFFTPLQGGLVCLVYALDPETRSRLRNCSLRHVWNHLSEENRINEYPVKQGITDSITEDNKRAIAWLKPRETSSLTSGYEQTSFKTFTQDKSS